MAEDVVHSHEIHFGSHCHYWNVWFRMYRAWLDSQRKQNILYSFYSILFYSIYVLYILYSICSL